MIELYEVMKESRPDIDSLKVGDTVFIAKGLDEPYIFNSPVLIEHDWLNSKRNIFNMMIDEGMVMILK